MHTNIRIPCHTHLYWQNKRPLLKYTPCRPCIDNHQRNIMNKLSLSGRLICSYAKSLFFTQVLSVVCQLTFMTVYATWFRNIYYHKRSMSSRLLSIKRSLFVYLFRYWGVSSLILVCRRFTKSISMTSELKQFDSGLLFFIIRNPLPSPLLLFNLKVFDWYIKE